MTNRKYVIPDVYVNEFDNSNDVIVNNTTIGLGFAGVFEKGKIGLNKIDGITELVSKLGLPNPTASQNPNIVQDWHGVKQLINASSNLNISRAITTSDKSAYQLCKALKNEQFLTSVKLTGVQLYITKENIETFALSNPSAGLVFANEAFYDSYISGSDTVIRFLNDTEVDVADTFDLDLMLKFTNSEMRSYLLTSVYNQYAICSDNMIGSGTGFISKTPAGLTTAFTVKTPKVLELVSTNFFTNIDEEFYLGTQVGSNLAPLTFAGLTGSVTENMIVETVTPSGTFGTMFTTDVEHLTTTLTGVYHEDDENFEDNLTFPTTEHFVLLAKNVGAWGNNIKVNMYGSKFLNSREGKNIAGKYNYRTFKTNEMVIDVDLEGSPSERFLVSTSKTDVNDDGAFYYIEDVINSGSELISIFMNESATPALEPQEVYHSMALSNGVDNTTVSITDLTDAYSVFADKNLYIPFVLSGGTYLTEAQSNTLNQFIESNVLNSKYRLGSFCTPFSLLSNADIAEANDNWSELGFLISDITGSYKVYSTYVKVQKYRKEGTVTIPVNFVAIKNRCEVMQQAGEWNAVMGEEIGLLGGFLDVVYVPQSDEDLIIFNEKNLNPVVFNEDVGYYLQNDTTFLKTSSSFRDTDVRLLFYKLERDLAKLTRRFIGKKNTPTNRTELKSLIDEYFINLPEDALEEYTVVCDTSNNTEAKINANIIVADIKVKPYRTGKFIELNFTNEA